MQRLRSWTDYFLQSPPFAPPWKSCALVTGVLLILTLLYWCITFLVPCRCPSIHIKAQDKHLCEWDKKIKCNWTSGRSEVMARSHKSKYAAENCFSSVTTFYLYIFLNGRQCKEAYAHWVNSQYGEIVVMCSMAKLFNNVIVVFPRPAGWNLKTSLW